MLLNSEYGGVQEWPIRLRIPASAAAPVKPNAPSMQSPPAIPSMKSMLKYAWNAVHVQVSVPWKLLKWLTKY